MKKGITLIELMVVVIVLGILALIALPNIKNIKKNTQLSVALENRTNTQKASDRYFLGKQVLPTTEIPAVGKPSSINWNELVPTYIRTNPKDKDGMYYWIDYNGTVWSSDVDAPVGVAVGTDNKTVTWTAVDGAKSYNIGCVKEVAKISNGKITAGYTYKLLGTTGNTTFTSDEDLSGSTVVVSSESNNNFESVPVGEDYEGGTPIGEDYEGGTSTLPSLPLQTDGGLEFSLVLKDNGSLWGFGCNRHGQLGIDTNVGTIEPITTPVKIMTDVKSISAGDFHTLVLKTDNTLWAFGANDCGQLGIDTNSGTYNANPTPVQIMTDVKSMSAGGCCSLVIKNDDTLWSFGINNLGQLGRLSENMESFGENVANPIPTQIMTNVQAVSAGGQHTLVLKNDGSLWTFGFNWFGELGSSINNETTIPNPIPKQVTTGVKAISACGTFSSIIKTDNTLWSFGRNHCGELGTTINLQTDTPNPTPIKVLTDIKQVICGREYTMVIKSDDTLWGFGRNFYGNLGVDTNNCTNTPNPTPIKVMTNVKSVSAGYGHTLVITNENKLYTFGNNNRGQLGRIPNYDTDNSIPTELIMP